MHRAEGGAITQLRLSGAAIERHWTFDGFDNVPQADPIRWVDQLYATVGTTLGIDDAMLGELGQDFCQKRGGDALSLRDDARIQTLPKGLPG
jgi:hypothetical protein